MKSLLVLCIVLVLSGFSGCSSQSDTPDQLVAKSTAFQLYKSMESKDIFVTSTGLSWVVTRNYPDEGRVVAKQEPGVMGSPKVLSYDDLFRFRIKIQKSGSLEWIETIKRDFL